MIQTRAAVLHAVGQDLEVENLELLPPQNGEVLVKMHAAGVCKSDYHVMSGQTAHVLPAVLGHEGAGSVVAVGEGVSRARVGDHVVLNWIPYCGHCKVCRRDQTHLCRTFVEPMWEGTMLDGTCRLSKGGRPYRHLGMVACWAEYTVMPQECCVVVKKALPFEVAALLGCAVTTGVGAVLNRARVKPGASVVVFGAGGVGLSVVMGAYLADAAKIIVVDRSERKGDLAKEFGASEFVFADEAANQKIIDLTDGRGADYVFEAVGNTELQRSCLDAVCVGGMLVLIGLPGNHETMALPSAAITRDEKIVTGSIFGSGNADENFSQFGDYFLQGRLAIDNLVAQRFHLDQINQACEAMLGDEAGRCLILFD